MKEGDEILPPKCIRSQKSVTSMCVVGPKAFAPPFRGELLFLTSASVTRFDEISPLWHDVKYFGHFERVQLVFGKIFTLLMLILHAIGQSFIAVNGQKFNIQSINLVTLASTVTKQEIVIAFCFIQHS